MSPKDLLALTSSEDPLDSLTAIRLLREHLVAQERRSVLRARGEGFSWERIAVLLGQTRQSVWARYR